MTTTTIREVTVNYKNRARKIGQIGAPRDAASFIRSVLPDNSQEHLIAIYLDGSHTPIGFKVVSTGTANSAFVHPREIFQSAIGLGSCAVILAHNHPSGSALASGEDLTVTQRIRESGDLLGVKLLDHIIVTDKQCHSILHDR